MSSKKFDNLPKFQELPTFGGLQGCAWEVWGKGDQLGTVNLLTDEVVARAAREEVKTGKAVCLNWPINFPAQPLFHRKAPGHVIFPFPGIDTDVINDDELYINTQSGTQWDGLKHVGIFAERCFYQGIPVDDVPDGKTQFVGSADEKEDIKCGIHNMAEHGVCGRGVLIDMVKYYTDDGKKPLPYDPFTAHVIPFKDVKAAIHRQGVTFRQGDILILRMGFIQKYHTCSPAEREKLGSSKDLLTPCAGIERSEEVKAFLWDNHFAAVASDAPAFESLPAPEGEKNILHETIIGLFGMPIGELFDLEELAKVANQLNRHTFFFTSWPLRVLGGIASPPNAAATF